MPQRSKKGSRCRAAGHAERRGDDERVHIDEGPAQALEGATPLVGMHQIIAKDHSDAGTFAWGEVRDPRTRFAQLHTPQEHQAVTGLLLVVVAVPAIAVVVAVAAVALLATGAIAALKPPVVLACPARTISARGSAGAQAIRGLPLGAGNPMQSARAFARCGT